jgi:hypothetical protein
MTFDTANEAPSLLTKSPLILCLGDTEAASHGLS